MGLTGNTAAIAFGTTGFSSNIHQIGGTEQELPDVKDSHLGTATRETYIPGDLYESGEMEIVHEYDPDNPPSMGTVETITVTYPVPSGLTNGATLAGTGYIKKRKTADLINNELEVGTITVKWDGKTGPTFTDAS